MRNSPQFSRWSIVRLGGCALLVLAFFAGGARAAGPIAKRSYTVIPAGRYASFTLPGAKGYRVSLFSYAHQARLEVEQPQAQASVIYSEPGAARRGGLHYRFGHLGFVQMHWKPAGPFQASWEPQRGCRARKSVVQRGWFIGRFVFRAEGGFTEARARRVRGLKVRRFRAVCDTEAGRRPREELLVALSHEGRRSIRFRADSRETSDGRLEEFEASAHEVHGKLSVDRTILTGGAAVQGEFNFQPLSGTAQVNPPWPFVGTSNLVQSGSQEGWTGNLFVNFPGLGRTSLAGTAFTGHLIARNGGLAPFDE